MTVRLTPFPVALVVLFFNRRRQPPLDQMEDVPVDDPAGQALHQFRVRKTAKIVRQIRIDDFCMPRIQPSMNRPDGSMRPSFRAIPILFRWQIGFEDGLYHQHQRRPHHPIRDRRYPQGTRLAIWLRYPDPLDRFRSVVLLPQPFRQFPEPAFFPASLDVFESLTVHPRRSSVGLAAAVG
jgi:hypothetical protein